MIKEEVEAVLQVQDEEDEVIREVSHLKEEEDLDQAVMIGIGRKLNII